MLSGLLMPILLVFGLYHLLTWFNILRINQRAFWKRVGMASAAWRHISSAWRIRFRQHAALRLRRQRAAARRVGSERRPDCRAQDRDTSYDHGEPQVNSTERRLGERHHADPDIR